MAKDVGWHIVDTFRYDEELQTASHPNCRINDPPDGDDGLVRLKSSLSIRSSRDVDVVGRNVSVGSEAGNLN